MKAYRLHRSRFDARDATGALRSGGRWNSPGVALIYASSSLALCCLEIIVHLRDPELVPTDYVYTEITVPDHLCLPFPFERGSERYLALLESPVLSREWGNHAIHAARMDQEGIEKIKFLLASVGLTKEALKRTAFLCRLSHRLSSLKSRIS